MSGTTNHVQNNRRGQNITRKGVKVGRGNIKVTEKDRNDYDYGTARKAKIDMDLMGATQGNINGWFRKICRHIDESFPGDSGS